MTASDRSAPKSAVHSRLAISLVAAVAVIALGVSVLLWQKLSRIQEQLARQSADTTVQATQASANEDNPSSSACRQSIRLRW